jgi:hypothetical protein
VEKIEEPMEGEARRHLNKVYTTSTYIVVLPIQQDGQHNNRISREVTLTGI